MGAVLLQRVHPISCFSKTICLKLQNSSSYARELHAITSVIHKWTHLVTWRKIFYTKQIKKFERACVPTLLFD